jgi:hypothetical protein
MTRIPTQLDSLRNLPLDIRTVIDIGAGAQTDSLLAAYPTAHHHLFDPDQDLCRQLAENYRDVPHTIHNQAIGDSFPLAPEQIEWPAILKIDTDGDEPRILQACESIMHRVAVVMVETTRQHLAGIVAFADHHRLQLWDIVDLCYCGRHLHQVDMLFVSARLSDHVFQPFRLDDFQRAAGR